MRMRSMVSVAVLSMLASPLLADAGTVRGKVTVGKGDVHDAVVSVEGVKAAAANGAKAEVDQRDLAFVPHVLPVVVGTEVEFKNGDTVFHNVFSQSKPAIFNLGIMHGRSRARVFDQPGVVSLLCNVHSEMNGFVVVKENPYFAQPAAGGAYSIPNVPAGNYRLSVWHPNGTVEEKPIVVPQSGEVTVDFTVQQAAR